MHSGPIGPPPDAAELRRLAQMLADQYGEIMTYPTSWKRYCDAVGHVEPSQYGFNADNADINRWAARYRAARAFRGVVLEGYSDSTNGGYSGFCQVFFTWSAFERFLSLTGLDQSRSAGLFTSDDSERIGAQVAELDSDGRLYNFIHARCNRPNQEELQKWKNAEPHNFTYLVSAIRHVFVHGYLTPHADGAIPGNNTEICNLVSDHVLDVMDWEFTQRIESFYA